MNLVKSVLRIRFDAPTRPWTELRALLRSAAADPKAEMQAGPIVVDRKKEQTRINVQIRALGVEHESTGPLAQAAAHVLATVVDLNHASPFPDVEMMTYDAAFIEPFDMPFHQLVELIRTHYLTPTALAGAASDVGLIFDQREDGLLKHVQLGPMDRAQLASEILRWPNEKEIPNTFVFINAGYEKVATVGFSGDAFDVFLREAAEWQESQANELFNELKETGG